MHTPHLNEELVRREGDVRREISSDLHNRVLSRVALMMGEIDSLREIHPNDLETKIDQLKSSVSSIDDIARKLIEKNYPPELILGLKSAIIKLKQHFVVAYPELKIKVKFDGDDDMGLTEEFALNLYRIVEGALHNIVEHASASTVLINLVINESALTLEIIDDGKGFDTTGQAKLGHFGLRIMETMARSIGGNCTIFSTLGLGTKIVVHVPMATPAHLLG